MKLLMAKALSYQLIGGSFILADLDPMSETMVPSIQVFVRKNNKLAAQRPGTKVLFPRNSNLKPCCSQRP
jgi:hypothetical protein